MEPTTFIFITLAVIFLPVIALYNNLVRRRNQVERAFAGVDVQLKKRFDLIPNLVSTVKNHMGHERAVLENLTKLRTEAMTHKMDSKQKAELDSKVTSALKGLMVSVENYPQLLSNASFLQLQKSLHDVESHLSAARRNYNSSVTDYNNSVEVFPGNLVASMFGFKRKAVFEVNSSERENTNVKKLFEDVA